MSRFCARREFNLEYYSKLNGLEQSFFREEIETKELMQLILRIAELVEYFDLKKDPVKGYFLEKMQYILSRPYTLNNLKKKEDENTINKEMKKSRHSHFSSNVQKLEMQSLLQSNSEDNEGTIKLLQEDYEKQLNNQTLLVQMDLDNQMGIITSKLRHRKNKSMFSPSNRINNQGDQQRGTTRQNTCSSRNSDRGQINHDDNICQILTTQNQ
ncbi:unnamed protein product (macronuclear) [Paramecium tetraurelia]|uniref:Uncharacterized protein n=1 Tax=Paramecium tetraurelia TaxID=5888 RepID=A0BUF0_PARTE|nr:uncharacterized protein GSPATT00032399001 [Paramecium tetraurelia]CAK62167.1 unnamed protein product [Paramecium tetraurelia]|eukprot:XP_001429565.1 hypothetical protein (macronuclear) [Paramecium tetraurelia strain d4-2]